VKFIKNSEGAVAIMVGLVLVILIGVTAFAIDFGIVWVTNKQLYNASDAGALAGARALGYYKCVKSGNTSCETVAGVVTTGTEDQAVERAVEPKVIGVVNDNSAFDTSTLNVSESDITLGKWKSSTQEFTPGASDPNAVQVIVRKEAGTDNGSVRAFFGQIFSVNEYNTAKESIAAITGLGTAPPGELIPIAISATACPMPELVWQQGTKTSCIGWTTFKDSSISDPTIKSLIDGIRTGSTTTPEVQANEQINIDGGAKNNALGAFYNLWYAKKDAAGHWKILVPVYGETGDCSNPNTWLPVVGFATLDIFSVDCKGSAGSGEPQKFCSPGVDNVIKGDMVCNVVQEGRGGGGDFGTYGTIPGLVR
jgi:Flp pilus assembly protein TadG